MQGEADLISQRRQVRLRIGCGRPYQQPPTQRVVVKKGADSSRNAPAALFLSPNTLLAVVASSRLGHRFDAASFFSVVSLAFKYGVIRFTHHSIT